MAAAFEGDIVFRRPNGYADGQVPDWSDIEEFGQTAILSPPISAEDFASLIDGVRKQNPGVDVWGHAQQGVSQGKSSTCAVIRGGFSGGGEVVVGNGDGAAVEHTIEDVRAVVGAMRAILYGAKALSRAWDAPEFSPSTPGVLEGAAPELNIFTAMRMTGTVAVDQLVVLKPEWLEQGQ